MTTQQVCGGVYVKIGRLCVIFNSITPANGDVIELLIVPRTRERDGGKGRSRKTRDNVMLCDFREFRAVVLKVKVAWGKGKSLEATR
jgi:hypothetical protein